jgi:PTH1 family peptidyl-tRNA hydrolase
MFIVVGLGNPGSEYEGTRHNVGFGVVDLLARRLDVRFRSFRLHKSALGRRHGREILLVKPSTYMNNSGEAVAFILAETGSAPSDLIICCDDLHLPVGTLRMRKKGSDGGHNGLASVGAELGTEEFPRLRCGISGEGAPAPGQATAEYVLSDFSPSESGVVTAMTARAADGVLMIARSGIDKAMNSVNTYESP